MDTRRFIRRMQRFVVRLSLQWKIALSILFTFIIIVPSVALTLFYFTNILQRLTVVIDQDVTLGRDAAELSMTMLDIRRYERNYRLFGSDTERESVERLIAYAESIIVDARTVVSPSDKPVLDSLSDHLDIYHNSFLMLVEHVTQNPPETDIQQKARLSKRLNDFQSAYRDIFDRLDKAQPAERDSILAVANRDLDIFSLDLLAMSDSQGQPSYIQENLERSRQLFLEAAEELGRRSRENMMRHRLESFQTEARAKRNIISVLILTGFAYIFLVVFLPRYIVRPIKKLNRVFKKAEEGDLKALAPSISNDEIGDLARSYNRMIENLRKYDNLKTHKIASQKRAFDRLLENLDIPACILTQDSVAVYFNNPFAALFGNVIPQKAPEGGLDVKQISVMSEFYEEVQKKIGETSNNIVIDFNGADNKTIRMKGRIVRNALMKLESIVLVGILNE